jgi:tetratricopeptide (TPR) repeat protein
MHSLLSRALLGAAVLLALVLRWSDADAQPAPAAPTTSDAERREVASKLTDEAITAQDAKDYSKAIALYKQAYEIVPHPLLMFNIGQVYMLLGNAEEAEKFFRRYLQLDPDGPGASTARQFLASRPAHGPEPAPPGTDGTRATTDPADERPRPAQTSAATVVGRVNSEMSIEDRLRERDEQLKRADEIKTASYILMSAGGIMIVACFGIASQGGGTNSASP